MEMTWKHEHQKKHKKPEKLNKELQLQDFGVFCPYACIYLTVTIFGCQKSIKPKQGASAFVCQKKQKVNGVSWFP